MSYEATPSLPRDEDEQLEIEMGRYGGFTGKGSGDNQKEKPKEKPQKPANDGGKKKGN